MTKEAEDHPVCSHEAVCFEARIAQARGAPIKAWKNPVGKLKSVVFDPMRGRG